MTLYSFLSALPDAQSTFNYFLKQYVIQEDDDESWSKRWKDVDVRADPNSPRDLSPLVDGHLRDGRGGGDPKPRLPPQFSHHHLNPIDKVNLIKESLNKCRQSLTLWKILNNAYNFKNDNLAKK